MMLVSAANCSDNLLCDELDTEKKIVLVPVVEEGRGTIYQPHQGRQAGPTLGQITSSRTPSRRKPVPTPPRITGSGTSRMFKQQYQQQQQQQQYDQHSPLLEGSLPPQHPMNEQQYQQHLYQQHLYQQQQQQFSLPVQPLSVPPPPPPMTPLYTQQQYQQQHCAVLQQQQGYCQWVPPTMALPLPPPARVPPQQQQLLQQQCSCSSSVLHSSSSSSSSTYSSMPLPEPFLDTVTASVSTSIVGAPNGSAQPERARPALPDHVQ
eukprot:8978-Heterococcus_DN1.PRE.1